MGMRGPVLFAVWACTATALTASTVAEDAHASVSIAVTWEALLRQSTGAAVLTALDAQSVWENGRIFTYTRLRVDQSIVGDLPVGGEAFVRTMGGVVGKIGQVVEGEAVFVPGRTSLLFLRSGPAGSWMVAARGQGQFPVTVADPQKPARVVRSHAVGAVVPPPVIVSSAADRLAADVLDDRPLDDAVLDIAAAWGRAHAQP
jgi:hypothetical protein